MVPVYVVQFHSHTCTKLALGLGVATCVALAFVHSDAHAERVNIWRAALFVQSSRSARRRVNCKRSAAQVLGLAAATSTSQRTAPRCLAAAVLRALASSAVACCAIVFFVTS